MASGLKPNQRKILRALRELGGTATVAAIAEHLQLSVNGISQTLGVLTPKYVRFKEGTGGGAIYEFAPDNDMLWVLTQAAPVRPVKWRYRHRHVLRILTELGEVTVAQLATACNRTSGGVLQALNFLSPKHVECVKGEGEESVWRSLNKGQMSLNFEEAKGE